MIHTILSLKDRFSRPMKNAADNTKAMQRQLKMATNTVENFAGRANQSFLSITKYTAGTVAAITGLIAGLAIKEGFSEAMDLEGYRLQLETATKSTKKAADIMKYSIDLANKTPFEGGELVEGAAKLESMGMAAKEWLPKIGDMAAATNKPFDQAIEAVIDAQAGELERLKEFGITKAKITEKANQMYKRQTVVNNKGQIVDQDKFNNAMVAIMKDRFTGGMEKQSTTLKGIWSTVTGVTKSALSKIVGITEDGSIRQGSLYEMLKNKIKTVADVLEKWQNDGTLNRIADQVTNGVSKAIEFFSKTIGWLKDNMSWLMPVATGLLTTFIAFNVISKVVRLFKTLTTIIRGVAAAQGALNIVMAMNPIGLIAVAIGALIGLGVYLWKNWDTVKAKASELWGWLTNVWNNIKTSITNTVTSIVDKVKAKFSDIVSAVKRPINAVIEMINSLIDKVNSISVDIPDWVPGYGGETFGVNIPKIPAFATGTGYFKGGLARTDEHGGEIKEYPNGTRVIPHDLSKRMLSGQGGLTVNVTIQGNVYGNDDFANQVGNHIWNKVSLALGNV